MTDAKCVAALYLVAANRRPSEQEASQALTEFKSCDYRLVSVLRIAHPLVRGNGASTDLVLSYAQVDKALENPNAITKFGENILEEAIKRFATALNKNARTDADLADLLYLFILSRHPDSAEVSLIASTLNNIENRVKFTSIFVRTLQNSEEFKRNR